MLNRIKSVIKPSAGILLVALLLCLLLLSCAEELPEPEELASANEDKIAFVSDRAGGWAIYVMDPDGTGLKYVTTLGDEKNIFRLRFSWSPDGARILFDFGGQLYVINADGANEELLYSGQAFGDGEGPSWSPDGTKIAFHSWRDSRPEGTGMAEIYVMNADGTGQTRLTHSPTEDDWNPVWSPDGTKIAFSSIHYDEEQLAWKIHVMNADGTDQKVFIEPNNSWATPSWSPDGSKIAFKAWRSNGREIFVMEDDGTDLTRLTYNEDIDDMHPSWSPDGTKIVFSSNRDGNSEIYVMNADGTEQKRLTYDNGTDIWPSWSP